MVRLHSNEHRGRAQGSNTLAVRRVARVHAYLSRGADAALPAHSAGFAAGRRGAGHPARHADDDRLLRPELRHGCPRRSSEPQKIARDRIDDQRAGLPWTVFRAKLPVGAALRCDRRLRRKLLSSGRNGDDCATVPGRHGQGAWVDGGRRQRRVFHQPDLRGLAGGNGRLARAGV